MNTMKKEEMLREIAEMKVQVAHITLGMLQPFSNLLATTQRITYLYSQLEKLTPKQEEQIRPKLEMVENKDA